MMLGSNYLKMPAYKWIKSMGKFEDYNKKEFIAGIFVLSGVLVIVCEILFCLYKWFGIYPVIFSIGIILILIGLSISGDNRL